MVATGLLAPIAPGNAGFSCPPSTAFDSNSFLCVSTKHPAAPSIASILKDGFQNGNLGAVVAGVWHKGEPVVVGAIGDSIPGLPASPDMKHRTGNVAASFLTTLFMQLVDEGVVKMEDPVGKYLSTCGSVTIKNADKITLAMLARSTSGIEHFPGLETFQQAFYENPWRTWNPCELIGFGMAASPLFEPGTKWHFSDTNLVILALALQVAAGKQVHDMITGRFIVPLGLKDTVSPWTPAIESPVLHSFSSERGIWEEATFWNPQWIPFAGDMVSSQDDMRKWYETLSSGVLLSEKSQKELLAYPGFTTPNYYYAMGVGRWSNWTFTNPGLQGLRAAVGRHEAGQATVVIYNTFTQGSDQNKAQATEMFVPIAKALGLPVCTRGVDC